MRYYSKCMGSPLRAGNWAFITTQITNAWRQHLAGDVSVHSHFFRDLQRGNMVFSSGLGIFPGLILIGTAQLGCWTKLHKSLGYFLANNDKRVSVGLLISHTQSTVLIT